MSAYEEMLAILNSNEDDELMHYGTPRHSGRYPWGSGEDPYQHNRDFLSRVEELKKTGWTETPENIKKEFGLSTTEYRIEKSICKDSRRTIKVERARSLKEDGLNDSEIGRQMGVNESTVRSWLNEKSESRMRESRKTADFLKAQVDEKKMIDVGVGVERELGISKQKLETALYMLKREGYNVYGGRMEQVTNKGQWTTNKVLCSPEIPHNDIFDRVGDIKTINEYTSKDAGATFTKLQYPESMSSKRLKIRYTDEVGPDGFTGNDKDGVIEIRRGVKDLSLGNDHYSQVRILVDGTHYIKGMAVYSDNMPDGVDVVFNTNKKAGTPALGPKDNTVLKHIKSDPDNPFGSLIKANGQSTYIDKDGNEKLSLINKRAAEGDWTEWKDALPSQFLAKQSHAMAKKQLDLAKADKAAEFDSYMELNNPTIKKHLLKKFADECDSAAVHLQAAALPGQKYHVIIPVNSLKDTEVYAPQYENGTKLALIRYPHGGTFEIPILTVNNKNKLGKQMIGDTSIDAVGITKKNADRLSGADFDGDTVMCIPTHDKDGKVKITSTKPLKGLEDFDTKIAYGPETYAGKDIKLMTKKGTQMQMGIVSNLITDMTLAGAGPEEMARAVRHSMVVIDAEKHKLNYKQSEIDNGIAELHRLYQGKSTGGAATIISKAKGQESVLKRQGSPITNMKYKKNGDPNPDYDPSRPEGALIWKTSDDVYYPDRSYNKETGMYTIRTSTGEKIKYSKDDAEAVAKYKPVKVKDKSTGEVKYTNRDGDIEYHLKERKQQSTKMGETDDAYTLVSKNRYPMEILYADHANYMKALANQARKEVYTTGKVEYSTQAKKTYQVEVDSLMGKLNTALMNATRERAALRSANADIKAKQKSAEERGEKLESGDITKAGQQALTKYRSQYGSISRRDRNIDITDREWEAIQAGAISENKLMQILNNTDVDKLRERATPKVTTTLSTAKQNKIERMSESNFTIEQIAKSCGCSTATVYKYLKGGK